jgi:hypothetical protein
VARGIPPATGRARGRAYLGPAARPGGGRLDADAALPRVAHPEDEAWRYEQHAQARRSFAEGHLHALATSLHLSQDDIDRVAAEVPNADAFAARVVGAPPGGMRAISLAHAEVALAALDTDVLEGAA